MPKLMENQQSVWYPFATHKGLETQINGWLNSVRARVRFGVQCPAEQRDLCGPLDEMRLVKDANEQDTMRRAAQISAQAHIRAMQTSARMLRAGQDAREYHLEAEILHEFRQHGSQFPAYTSIVAAGANACVLHYRADTAQLRDGDLVLIDAGCELDGYASDITPHLPRQGRIQRPPKRPLQPSTCKPRRGSSCHQSRRPVHRPARSRSARALTRLVRTRLVASQQARQCGRRHRKTRVLCFLHAPHQPLDRHGCARLR